MIWKSPPFALCFDRFLSYTVQWGTIPSHFNPPMTKSSGIVTFCVYFWGKFPWTATFVLFNDGSILNFPVTVCVHLLLGKSPGCVPQPPGFTQFVF